MNLPHDTELEGLIIGSVLMKKKLSPFEKGIAVTEFFSLLNQQIWGAILEFDENNEPIEILDIVAKVDTPQVTGSMLSKMAMGLPFGDVRFDDIKRLKDLATCRRMIHSFRSVAQKASDKEPITDIIEEAQSVLDTLKNEQDARTGTSQTLIEVMEYEVFPRLDKFVSGELVKIPFGFEKLDTATNGGASIGELVVFGAKPKSGKALSLDTKIPTPIGWTTMGDLQVGDQVFDEKGNVCNVIATTPIMENRPCYELEFNNGTTVVADAQHEWLTQDSRRVSSERALAKRQALRQSRLTPSVYSVDKPYTRSVFPPIVTTENIASRVRQNDGKLIHYVRVCEPLQMPKQNLPLDPYVLGAWLGDGTAGTSGITTPDLEIIENIRDAGFQTQKQSSPYGHTVYKLIYKIRELRLYKNKHIPTQYLRASFEQRLALLQGLMDTDGYCDPKKGQCEFTNTNEQLSMDFLDLAGSLGINAKLGTGRAILYGRDISPKWRITFQTKLPVFRVTRKAANQSKCHFKGAQEWRGIKRVTPIESVPVKCIQVDSPSHMYLITDRFIPTHNSVLMLQIARHIASLGLGTLVASLEMLNYENGFRFLAQSSKYSVNVFRPDMRDFVADGLKAHAKEHYNLPLYFDQKARTTKAIGKEIQRLKDSVGISACFVDYVQLLRNDKRSSSRVERIEEAIFDLKEMAMKHEIVVYTAAQFNREGIKSDKPTLADFDGASAIEKTANLGLFWVLEQDFNIDADGRKGEMWIELGRSVAADKFEGLVFHGKDARFTL